MANQESRNRALHDGKYLRKRLRIVGEQETQGKRKGQHPLANRYFGKHMVDQVGGRLDHPPGPAAGADKIAGSDFEQPQAGPKGEGQDARSNPRRLRLKATECS